MSDNRRLAYIVVPASIINDAIHKALIKSALKDLPKEFRVDGLRLDPESLSYHVLIQSRELDSVQAIQAIPTIFHTPISEGWPGKK